MILLAAAITWMAVDQYLFCPQFVFKEPKVFSGDSIYNPYKNFTSQDYVKSNFHAHSKFGLGITNGEGLPKDIWETYEGLGYVFHAVSQYHKIDKYGETDKKYISSYEHGYNLKKTHQLLLGGDRVLGKDYIFPQTLNQKQYILSRLAQDTSNVIVLNHPDLSSGYTERDLKYLQYYDCIEVLNPAAQSFAHWDTALSAGKKVFILGNDDLHNIKNRNQIARFCTLVSSPTQSSTEALASIKSGSSIAMWLPQVHNESMDDKKNKLASSKITLESIDIKGDELVIEFEEPIDSLMVIGQNGKVVHSSSHQQHFNVPFEKDCTYLRVEYTTKDGIRYFLNPLFRYQKQVYSRSVAGTAFVSRKPFKVAEAGFFFGGWVLLVLLFLLRKKWWSYFSNFRMYLSI